MSDGFRRSAADGRRRGEWVKMPPFASFADRRASQRPDAALTIPLLPAAAHPLRAEPFSSTTCHSTMQTDVDTGCLKPLAGSRTALSSLCEDIVVLLQHAPHPPTIN